MVHAAADVPAGPASLDSVRVQFNDQRLVSDAGLLIAATLAERLGIEETVNESVWLDPRAPGAALPGRKVMTLVHGMVTGANSIDQMNVLRAGSTGLILGHRVMAPSTLGTFLRAFTFGHVRQLDHVLDVTLGRAWQAGAGPGDGPLVIDLDSFIGEVYGYEKQAPPTGTRASTDITRSSPPVPIPARYCTSATARARPTRSAAPSDSWTSCSRACTAPAMPA
jgi:hypothetical protein